MNMTSDEIRTAYLSFFESKGHKIIPSSSLIPQGDPTLLLTTAGMVQIKPYFMGEEVPPSPRLTSCQKCFRTTDIESVGDPTHLTFFEMLGNFSVGDYFKKEAIAWAWELVTEKFHLPPERLWITIFRDDDEAHDIWRKIGIPEDKILRMDEDTNFWGPAGDSGPCGPCSEIHYDFGKEVGCGKPTCYPGCDCGRYSEIWNLVFTQFNQDKQGNRTPLPKPNIDTGMGLERITAILQGKKSVYETDLFIPLMNKVSELSGKKYGTDSATDNAMRVVAEHSRGIAFLIGDGVMPSNEGRGYVLRRLLRRAALFGRRLGLDKPFLTEIARIAIEKMGNVYPDTLKREDFILKVIGPEETKFGETLDEGLHILEKEIIPLKNEYWQGLDKLSKSINFDFSGQVPVTVATQNFLMRVKALPSISQTQLQEVTHAKIILPIIKYAKDDLTSELISGFANSTTINNAKIFAENNLSMWKETLNRISGEEAFVLYDTYGFPIELTKEIATGRGFSVDLAGFEKEMEKQRERAKASHKFVNGEKAGQEKLDLPATVFTGYKTLDQKTKILAVLINNEPVKAATEGQEAGIILEKTSFYGEMGGQVGDTGEIKSTKGRFIVTNTLHVQNLIVHQGHIAEGSLKTGDRVEALVDKDRRADIARNHTATHLLQAALRKVLGEHVQQRGSLVAPERFRFDFSHLVAMSKEEIDKVNNIVNENVRRNLKVADDEIPYKQALQEGVTALFGEKYGDVVRVIRIGKPPISAELCGGTHTSTTGEIGFFHIVSESSIGSGLRRIEAVTGRGAEKYIAQRFTDLEKVAEFLETKPESVLEKAQSLTEELKNERRQIQALQTELSKNTAGSLLDGVEEIKGVKVLIARVPPARIDALREMSDMLKDKLGSGIVVLGSVYEDKPAFVVAVTPDLVAKGYKAGDMIKKIAGVTGGGGGGKPTLAQAGGRDKDKLDEALKLAKSLV